MRDPVVASHRPPRGSTAAATARPAGPRSAALDGRDRDAARLRPDGARGRRGGDRDDADAGGIWAVSAGEGEPSAAPFATFARQLSASGSALLRKESELSRATTPCHASVIAPRYPLAKSAAGESLAMTDLSSEIGFAQASGRSARPSTRTGRCPRPGFSERLFALLFSGLVYPQIWEDPDVDMEAMALAQGHRVVTIASGGCNVLAYLTRSPARIDAVDLNTAHIALNRLKLAAVRHLPAQADLFRFFGEAGNRANIGRLSTASSRPISTPDPRAIGRSRNWRGQRRIAVFDAQFLPHRPARPVHRRRPSRRAALRRRPAPTCCRRSDLARAAPLLRRGAGAALRQPR